MSRTAIDREILAGFLEEARGYLPGVRGGLAAFRANPTAGRDTLEEAHRFVHTIKGAAAMVGLAGLSHIAFGFEEAVEHLMEGRLPPTPATFAALDRACGHVEAYLDGVETDTLQEDALVAEAVPPLRALAGLASPAPAGHDDDSAPPGEPADNPFAPPPADDFDLPDFADIFAGPLPPFSAADTAVMSAESETLSDGDLPKFTLPTAVKPAPPPVPAAAPADVSAELLEVFRMEAEDHLRALTTLLPEARKDPTDKDRWQDVRRAAHTLKGTAAMVGFADVTAVAHRMEDLLDGYYDGTRVAAPHEIDLLLAATDAIDDAIAGRGDAAAFPQLLELFAALPPTPAVPDADPAAEPDVTDAEPAYDPPVTAAPLPTTPARKEAAEAFVRVPIDRLNEIVKLVGELVINRTAFEQRMGEFARLLGEMGPSADRLRKASVKLETGYETAALAGGRMGGTPEAFAGGDGFDDLELDRYTEFHLISRELAETTNDVQTLATDLGHLRGDFDGLLTRQARLASEVEDRLMRLRMVPLAGVASKLHRTVRNAATVARKKAELVLEGERTGLDKTVLEAMADPLLHLLRNAVDHGLETPEVRVALGKPAAGTIRLKAGHEGSQVVLTITDDGRGIDAAAVRAMAVARGVVPADAVLSQEQVESLLFAPGFSTKAEITELSGRGVGLDVVKSKVESLKGTVSVASAPGRGTTFTVRLPMSLAVTRAMLVRTNHQTFAIPLDAVEQILRFEEADVQKVGREQVLSVGGKTYPVAHLGRLLNLKQPADDTVKRPPVLLLNADGKRVAVVVEYLVGGREIVIKNLGAHLKRVPGVSGATLLGDGGVVLILNPAEILRAGVAMAASTASRLVTPVARPRAGTTVMIVDDSPSVRRVLTGLVERNGWTAVTAKDGVEALETLQRGAVVPDVLLSDIEMPRMDGYELLSTLRGLPSLSQLPVVMITSRAAEKHRKKAMDLGASAYVTKPYQDESLVAVVRQLARK